ncbi:uncharacterized protein LACBIDRAFT_336281, partial [Laccaria bicolor S238N-H82]
VRDDSAFWLTSSTVGGWAQVWGDSASGFITKPPLCNVAILTPGHIFDTYEGGAQKPYSKWGEYQRPLQCHRPFRLGAFKFLKYKAHKDIQAPNREAEKGQKRG